MSEAYTSSSLSITPQRDSHKLSEKVAEVLRNEELRKRFSTENIRIAQERANRDRNFGKLEVAYKNLIDEK